VRFVRLDEVPEGALGRVKFGGIKSVERAVEKIVRSYSQVQPTAIIRRLLTGQAGHGHADRRKDRPLVLAGPADPVIQRHWIELPARAGALCAQAQMKP
jgi:hypothetical protein